MGMSDEKEIVLNCNLAEKRHLIEKTLYKLNFSFTRLPDNIYRARTKKYFWGEGGEIVLIYLGESKFIKVISKNPGMQLLDGGRNMLNIDSIESVLMDYQTESLRIEDEEIASLVDYESLHQELIDNYKLYVAEIISIDEWKLLKTNIIAKYEAISTTDAKDQILFALVELQEFGALSKDDILQIKNNIEHQQGDLPS